LSASHEPIIVVYD